MKIGNVIHFAEKEKLEKYFEQLVFFGFDNCQLGSWHPKDWTDENAEMVKELCEKYGITISAFWCGWSGPVVWNFYDGQLTLGLVPPEYRAMRVQQLCDGADWAKNWVLPMLLHIWALFPKILTIHSLLLSALH